MNAQFWLVELEFGRVQTYLFAVSELRAMLGANTLLGEVLRGQMVKTPSGKIEFIETLLDAEGKERRANLPWLAVQCEAALPDDVQVKNLFPKGPLDQEPIKEGDRDDPMSASHHGILARDGGHFHAIFPDDDKARDFIDQACALIGHHLPGLSVKANLVSLTHKDGQWTRDSEAESKRSATGEDAKQDQNPQPIVTGADLLDLPQFQVCEVTQQGPAEETITEDNRPKAISGSVREKRVAADRFDGGRSKDILGLLRATIFSHLKRRRNELFPNAFEKVAFVSGYLAVIAADGNGIGDRSTKWRKGPNNEADYFAREARGETFYHRMRTKVRAALVASLEDTFCPWADAWERQHKKAKGLPFRLMMVGGDDVLLVCDAAYAMRFVVNYASELDKVDLVLPDECKKLHVGVGVAIVKKTFPFHRAHALAEELQSSAKRYYRSLAEQTSTVDWLSVSEAWHEDVADVRRRDSIRRYGNEILVLSAKPYRIRSKNGSPAHTLEALRAAAEHAAEKRDDDTARLARSQLMALAHTLPLGQQQADFAYDWAPEEVRNSLESIVSGTSVWEKIDGRHLTRVLDFLELYELERLRLAAEAELKPPKKVEATHD